MNKGSVEVREGPSPLYARLYRENGNPVRLVPLADIGRWTGGGTPSKSNPAFWANGTIPWVSPKDMKVERISTTEDHITQEAVEQSATQTVGKGAVLVVVRSGILKHSLPVAIAERKVALNQDLKAVELNDSYLPEYVAWALRASAPRILQTCAKSGTTVQNLEMPRFLRYEIPFCPIAEQRRIVAELETQLTRLDASVAALKRVQANLKRYRASVLGDACEGRLVPNEAETAVGEGRAFESGGELMARLIQSRRALKKRGPGRREGNAIRLPELPRGWAWATVEDLAADEPNSITDGPFGSNLKTEHYVHRGPRVVRLQNIGDGAFIDEKAHIAPAHFERLSKHQVFAGDIVVAALGDRAPRACMVPETIGPAIVKADCVRFRPYRALSSKFLCFMLNAEPTRKRAKAIIHGIGRPRLNLGEIKSISLPVPPLAEQARIVAEVERRLSVIEELESTVTCNLKRAARLRQSILARAFDGAPDPSERAST